MSACFYIIFLFYTALALFEADITHPPYIKIVGLFTMSEPGQRRERGYSKSGFEREDPESRFRFHLTHAKQAAEEAKEHSSPSSFTRCLSHAKNARSLAKKHKRPDLEQEAQLATIEFLETAGRRREATEARIVAAAMVDNLEAHFELLPGTDEKRLVSVGGIPIDELIQLLEEDQEENRREQCPSSSSPEQTPATGNSSRSEFAEAESSREPEKQLSLPKLVLEGRQIRDIHGKLATVLTNAPKLRRKPNFKG